MKSCYIHLKIPQTSAAFMRRIFLELKMEETKIIHCPICKRKVATWDGKSQSYISTNCKKCKKRIVYKPDTQEIEVKNIPERDTSSGMRFY